jgi:hypothetical protein
VVSTLEVERPREGLEQGRDEFDGFARLLMRRRVPDAEMKREWPAIFGSFVERQNVEQSSYL